MSLALTEEQQLLRRTAEAFFRERSPVRALRELRDRRDAQGFDRELWAEMAGMGWVGACLPEQYGGIDCGFVELGVIMEAAGRTLAASPLFSTAVLGAGAVLLGGSEAQRSDLLPRIAAGELLLTLACQEASHYRPGPVETRAEPDGDGYVLSGCKRFVPDGHVADRIVVPARTRGEVADEGGVSLFVVEREAPGVQVQRLSMVDSRNLADVTLAGVRVARDALLGEPHEGGALLGQVVDRGNIALCAEMLGSMQEAFERTLAYLKQREQFGAPIGSFQALQHRAARMFCEIELAKSLVIKALRAVDEEPEAVPLLASAAKVHVSETFRLVSDEAIQMHGGIGMTDDEEIGFFLKRARVAQQMLGDEHYHLQCYAALRGY